MAADAHNNADLLVNHRPTSKRGGKGLLGLVRQHSQNALRQITFIDGIGFNFSAEKFFKKGAWAFQQRNVRTAPAHLAQKYSPVFGLSSGCAQAPDLIVEVTVSSI